MNRFKIVRGKEKDFERVWRERDTFLDDVMKYNQYKLIENKKDNKKG